MKHRNIKVLTRPCLYEPGIKLSKWVNTPLNIGFVWIEVVNLSFSLQILTSKNEKELFCSTSKVKFKLECWWLIINRLSSYIKSQLPFCSRKLHISQKTVWQIYLNLKRLFRIHLCITPLPKKRVKNPKKSAIIHHILLEGHNATYDDFSILTTESNEFELHLNESLLIKRENP